MSIENAPRALKNALESNIQASPGSLLTLYETCEDVLKENYPINLNGREVLASTLSCDIKYEDSTLEARLAREPQSNNIIYLIYEKGKLPEETRNTHLLKLTAPAKKGMYPVLCFDDIDLSNGINNSEDYEFAFNIAARLRREKIEQQNRKKIVAKEKREDILDSIIKTSKYIGISALAISGLFYHTLLGEPDAHIGPVPMPSPIEWFTDIGHAKEHRAQGFEPPMNIKPLTQNELNSPIQINSSYSVTGSDVLEYETYEEVLYAGPGLHEVALSGSEGIEKVINEELFNTNYPKVKEAATNCEDTGKECIEKIKDTIEEVENSTLRNCKIVQAEIDTKKLRVFAKDVDLSEKLDISTSGDEVSICPKSGTVLPDASVYFHQDEGR